MTLLGCISVFWAYFGFSFLIASAIVRLTPIALEVSWLNLSAVQYIFAAIFTVFMIYAEGIGGFHKKLAPRFAARAKHLSRNPRWLHILLAPFFCVGYFYANRKRVITSFALTFAIVILVIIVHQMPQPWRGIIDVGVILGLFTGLMSMGFWLVRVHLHGYSEIETDLPEGIQGK